MRQLFDKYGRKITITLVIAVSVLLLISAIAMLVRYSNEVAETSTSKAQFYTIQGEENVKEHLSVYQEKAIVVAAELKSLTSEKAFTDYLSNLSSKDGYADLYFTRYIDKNGILTNGSDKYTEDKNDAVYKYIQNHGYKTAGYIGSFDTLNSDGGVMTVIGFYAPIENSQFANGIILYYTRSLLESFYTKDPDSIAEFSCLVNENGDILVGKESADGSDISETLRLLVGEKEPVDQVLTMLLNGEDGTVPVNIEGVDYIISICGDNDKMADLSVIELYEVDLLYVASFEFTRTIVAILILFSIIIFFLVVYLLLHRMKLQKDLLNMNTNDRFLQCLNRYGFEKEAERILSRNKNSYFAIINFQLRHTKYLEETYGANEISNILMHLRMTCRQTVGLEETYGHIENGSFLFLLHAKNRQDLLERLKVHSFIASKYKGANTFDVHLKYGIYEYDSADTVTITQMVDFANETNNTEIKANAETANNMFRFYDDNLRKIRLLNEDMELRMESALQNGEFQVFYQPKYNLDLNRQDGSEALVRWYDSKTNEYNRPALFMALFESNGFIVKLDKYIYSKVCEYISYSMAEGRKVYPVSVNVSRITAVQPDFVEYYVKEKKKYGISDGQIMIEFTESFAYENYSILRKIVDDLHANGFKCSIDDFGCGYSSYRILKSLPMDEIKLDKFFLDKGITDESDRLIFQSIIKLGKDLGMKVTQEGVEQYEDIGKLRELGCNVIQGYYYAKPLPLSDYLNFVANSREHRIN